MANLEIPAFPEALHVRLKVLAVRERSTLRAFVIAALEDFATRQEKEEAES